MSHLVQIQTKIKDPDSIAAACRRLRLPDPYPGTVRLFSAEATGVVVQLPGWQYPVVFDVSKGEALFDNFEGKWGDPRELDRFLQAYAVERAKQEARRKGLSVHEETLQDGSIKVQILDAV